MRPRRGRGVRSAGTRWRSDGGAPRLQQSEQLVEIVAERFDGGTHLAVGRNLDRLALLATSVRQLAAVDETVGAEPILGGVDLIVGPGAGPEIGAHGQTPPELGEQADLRARETCGRPRRGVRVATRLAQPVGPTPCVAERITG